MNHGRESLTDVSWFAVSFPFPAIRRSVPKKPAIHRRHKKTIVRYQCAYTEGSHINRTFQKEREISIANEFQISNSVVNKQSKIFKSIIKLDSNFDIHILSNSNQFLKKGFDKDVGMSYYKLYFKEEQ